MLEDLEGRFHRQAVDVHLARGLDDLVGIVGLVDAHGNAVGGVGDLGHGVDDAAVVLLAVVGGYDIQAVADLEQGREVRLVGSFVMLGQIILAQLIRQSLDLSLALFIERRLDVHHVFAEGEVLAGLEHGLHDLGGHRRPGAVFHQGDRAVFVAALNQMVDKLAHEGENLGVVGGGGQHHAAIAEGVLHALKHILAGKIRHGYLGAALGLELLGKQLHCLFCVAVDRGVGDEDALGFHAIGRPGIVLVKIVPQVFGQHGAVEGGDDLDVELGSLFQNSLDLRAVFADDAEVVAACFAVPALRVFHVVGAELAEAVSREEDLVLGLIGHDDLGPVDHGSLDEIEGMLAELEGVALFDDNAAVGKVGAEEVQHHGEGLGRADENSLGIDLHKLADVGAVVGLHMLDHQVVRRAAAQCGVKIVQPGCGEVAVYGVHDRDLLVENDVGVVGHAERHVVLTLEQVDLMVVDADIANVFGNVHRDSPLR